MPYNPAATFDPSLITRTGSAIAGAITDAGQHFAQIKKQDKAAKAIFDALEPEEDGQTGALKAHPLGLTRDAFNSLSSQDRIAKISGFMEAEAVKSARRKEQMAVQEMQMRGEELGLRKQDAAARLAALTREQGAEDALAKALQSANLPAINTPGPFGGPVAPGGVTPDRLLQALAQNPQAVNARGFANVDNLMRALGQEKGPKGLSFMESPTGATIALSPDTGAFQYDPFSKAQAQSSQLQPRDALKAYNDNQDRISKLMSNRKMAEQLAADPKNKLNPFDVEAIDAEIEAIQTQQEELRSQAGFKKPTTRTGSTPTNRNAPKKGDVVKGYRFKGGNPADKNNWEKVQ